MNFTIVTISFNQARFLAECIESVASQKQPGDQYIVVDPGSSDGSRGVIAAAGSCIDDAVLEPDRGPADGLNRGFAKARGDLLCYINADDRLLPGALAYARALFARNPDMDVMCGAIRIVDDQGRVAARCRTSDAFDLRRYAAGICTIGQQATFFRRSVYERAGGFNADNRICWDGELLVDMALAGARFVSVRRTLGDFRIYGESITGSGKFVDKLWAEHGRIASKIAAHGVPLYTPLRTRLERAIYKINPLRHLGYYLVGD